MLSASALVVLGVAGVLTPKEILAGGFRTSRLR